MKKQFEDFQKMKIKEACKAIEDMTFSFINPTTILFVRKICCYRYKRIES
mgnify:CR=1 FL=1